MDILTIQKNKGEVFKCQFTVEGASIEDAVVRLCLEFEDNKNMFFYGSLSPSGECLVEIPKLKEVEARKGILTVEAIVDSVYFKLYESPVEIKNPIEMTMVQTPKIKQTVPETHVKLEGFVKERPSITEASPVIVEEKEISETSTLTSDVPKVHFNPYVPLNLKNIQPKSLDENIFKRPLRK